MIQQLSLFGPLFAAALVALGNTSAATESFSVDATASRVTIGVGKAGVLSFVAGHTHQVAGPIESGAVNVDRDDPSRSRIEITIASAALKVSGDEPPDDRPKVQETMESEKVLNVAAYPRITFESTGVKVRSRTATSLDLVVDGRLTIRGRTQPVSAPVRVELADRSLTASGRFSIKQTAFGIQPVSVAGVVTVKDALDIAFSITARSLPAASRGECSTGI